LQKSDSSSSGFVAHISQDGLVETGALSKDSLNKGLRFLCDKGFVIGNKSWYTVVYPPPNTIEEESVQE
jgi:hypothetical protein